MRKLMKLCIADDIVGIKNSYILQGNNEYYICFKNPNLIHIIRPNKNFYINNSRKMFELISNSAEIYEFYKIEFMNEPNLKFENLNIFKRCQHVSFIGSVALVKYSDVIDTVFLNYYLIKDYKTIFLLLVNTSIDLTYLSGITAKCVKTAVPKKANKIPPPI